MAGGSVRDIRVLTWIGKQRGVPMVLLPWLLGRWSPVAGQLVVGERVARRWVERVEAGGLVERVRVLGEPWVLLSQHGARLMGVGWTRYGVPRSRAEHRAAKNVVRWWLEETHEGHWVDDWRVERSLDGEGHRPDGGWLLPGGELAAVEVELSRKTSFRHGYRDIMERMPFAVDDVWWFADRADHEWLSGRLRGSKGWQVRPLPTLQVGTHPDGCSCAMCRVAVQGVQGAPLVSSAEMRKVWESLAESVPQELGGKLSRAVRGLGGAG